MRATSQNDPSPLGSSEVDPAVSELARAAYVGALKRAVRDGTYRPDLERLAAVLLASDPTP